MPTHENIVSQVNKYEPCQKLKREPHDVSQHTAFLNNAYTLLLMDNLMENSNMVMLSMEPRKEITYYNNYCSFLLKLAIGNLLNFKSAEYASNSHFACFITALK